MEGARFQKPRRGGFTLVEIMIVVIIIGLLASLAIPAFLRVRASSYASRIANDYRLYRDAFEIYYVENGVWPADNNHGHIPPEMEGRLPGFDQESPSGDFWDWDRNAAGAVAGVSLYGEKTDEAVMVRVDEILDDGDLSTGKFYHGPTRYTFELD
ncbi:prepilin-type N-terminal cleavage/methylation domain-containing protein [Puniceicoccus vermicola]|uniref:Prepilin-type N-terminal cleavage/methylation domain-containing protein n=2 Tax=Puniceicoccus vermicola TaxID=388746 RepID=A0A7X1B0W7_9BACT|nr:prepilin-type N-terminal cleavage/methylation domain-containing protein [Puniceicoccus vermicola]